MLDPAVATDEEFLEIPFDPLHAQQPRHLLLHPLVDGFGIVAVDVRFAQDGEGDSVVDLAKLLNGVIGAWILVTELIAGEAEDDEGVGPVGGCHGFVEFLQPLELRSEAAFRGRVYDQHDFVFQLGQRVGFAFLYLSPSEDVRLADGREVIWGLRAVDV